jgi:uncharacterized protein with PIN domain
VNSKRPTFVADEMLGRLAKWLRLLGYDTIYENNVSDTELLDIAEREGRIILTRDTELVRRKRCRRCIFITSDHWREQLAQVWRDAELDDGSLLTLCPVCNYPLRSVDRNAVESLVPPYVFKTQKEFSACEKCSRVFWSATHVSEILNELRGLNEERSYEE